MNKTEALALTFLLHHHDYTAEITDRPVVTFHDEISPEELEELRQSNPHIEFNEGTEEDN